MRRVFSRPVPTRYYKTGGRIAWPEDVLAEQERLRAQIAELQQQEATFLRDAAYRLGLAAKSLEELRSDAGNGFVEIEERYRRHDVRRAREENAERHKDEWAYLCANPYSFGREDQIGCGWVKGIPDQRAYDNIGSLAGSAGTEDYCRICGALIGVNEQIVS